MRPARAVLVALDAVDEAAAILPSTPHRKTKASASEIPWAACWRSRVGWCSIATPRWRSRWRAQSSTDRPQRRVVGGSSPPRCGYTLAAAGDARAEEAVRRALALLEGKRLDLLLMEAGLLAGRLGIEPAAAEKAKAPDGFEHTLGSPEGFAHVGSSS